MNALTRIRLAKSANTDALGKSCGHPRIGKPVEEECRTAVRDILLDLRQSGNRADIACSHDHSYIAAVDLRDGADFRRERCFFLFSDEPFQIMFQEHAAQIHRIIEDEKRLSFKRLILFRALNERAVCAKVFMDVRAELHKAVRAVVLEK